jgi:WD40 repeat protein
VYWQPGQELKTRPYKIEETIGQGGFGVTYKARHLGLKHQVVLKTPNATLRNDPAYPRFEQRFLKEGQMLAQLSQKGHASIVRVSDLFTENDIPCLVMDLVPGDSLFNLVQQQGAIPETEAVGYIRQIAEALIVSHEMGIVHRDAHALNIMVANQTRAVLIDFGIAGDIAPIVSKTRLAFNPAFAPFEQIFRGSGLPTVDVYSLGASLYYAVTGQLPTSAVDRKDDRALIPPQQHNPQISDKLQTAIIQAMALKAADRPQTMRDFLTLLQPAPKQQQPAMATQKVMPPPIQAFPQAIQASGREDCTVRLWDVATGRELQQLTGHTDDVNSVAFSPNGKILASGNGDILGGWDTTVRLWDVATGRELKKLTGHTDSVNSVAFSPNGKILASGSGDILGSGDNTVRLWDVATGRQLQQLTGHTEGVTSVAFSPNGKILASGSGDILGSGDNTVRLWDVATGRQLQQLTGHTEGVTSVAFSPNGQILASGSRDNTVRLWDVATGRELFQLTGHTNDVNSVAFSPNGQTLASGSEDHTVRLWDVATGRELQQFTGHKYSVYSVAFSPDGQILASGSSDKTVRLWDVATGRELQQLTGHTDGVKSVAISPDRLLASGSSDGVVRLWRL